MTNSEQDEKKIVEALNSGLGARMNLLLGEFGLSEFAFERFSIKNSDKHDHGDVDTSAAIGCRWVYDPQTGWFRCV